MLSAVKMLLEEDFVLTAEHLCITLTVLLKQ